MISRYPFLQNTSFDFLVQYNGKMDFIEKLAIPAFSIFFEELSNKHQKRVRIVFLVHEPTAFIEQQIKTILEKYLLTKVSEIILINKETNLSAIFYKSAIQMIDSDQPVKELVWESYSYGLPNICLQSVHSRDVMDSGCNIILPYQQPHENIRRISDAITMLYFDQECLKLLKKNAYRRHETYMNWASASPAAPANKTIEHLQ